MLGGLLPATGFVDLHVKIISVVRVARKSPLLSLTKGHQWPVLMNACTLAGRQPLRFDLFRFDVRANATLRDA